MFINVARFVVFFAVLSLIFIALSAYDRWAQRQRLKSEHASGTGQALSQEDYIQKGLAEYDRSWRKKLIYGVFLLPLIAIVVLIYVANYQ